MHTLRLSLLLLLGGSFLLIHPLSAQSEGCATMEHHQHLLDTYPDMLPLRAEIEQFTQAFVQQGEPLSAPVYTIPVVVHIVWKDSSQRLPLAHIQEQINSLNQDFRRMNADTNLTPAAFQAVAADVELEFCLASQTPDGAPSNGILYVPTTENDFTIATDEVKFSNLGGSDAWPRAEYLNLWVCQLEAGGVTGYATLPGGPPAIDGVVVDVDYVGSPASPAANGSIGRVLTHEVGHWFNLNHVWGDGDCSVDDGVADTPIQDGPIYDCPSFPLLNCNTGPDGAMFMNYLQYVDDSCMNLFSQGQKTRMRAQLQAGSFRFSLRNSPGCDSSTQCPMTSGLAGQSSQPDQVELSWFETTYAGSYELRYRPLGSGSWSTASASEPATTIPGLSTCTIYEWQVRTLCVGQSYGPYSLLQYVTTAGCQQGCGAPDSITLEPGIKSGLLQWSPSPNALTYQVQYQALGDTTWQDTLVTDTSLMMEDLRFCQSYRYRLQSRCLEGYSGFSLVDTFTTVCDNYCISQGSSTEFEWIEQVLIG
ncbi:MAG: M43 family zinc metalloprotease, partial [Bacteroidota bacterium]